MDCIMNRWDDKQCLMINNTVLSEILKKDYPSWCSECFSLYSNYLQTHFIMTIFSNCKK